MYSASPFANMCAKIDEKSEWNNGKAGANVPQMFLSFPSLCFCLHYFPFHRHSIYTRMRPAHTRINVKSAANQASLIEFFSSDALSAQSQTFGTKIMAFLFAASLWSPLSAGMPVCVRVLHADMPVKPETTTVRDISSTFVYEASY